MLNRMRVALLCLMSLLWLPAKAQERIVFSTAPTQSTEDTIALYQPLMAFLSRKTGLKFEIRPAHDFVQYAVKMRNGEYDMLFDGPHFVGWRMERQQHHPLARLPGDIRIVVATTERSKLADLDELGNGHTRVCAFASPNMLTMAFLSHFPHPARQPVMVREQGFAGLEECLRSGRGDVAVLRDKLWEKMDQTGLRLLSTPRRSYPERTFSINRKIDPAIRQQIAEALTSEEGAAMAQPILQRFKQAKFIKAEASEYKGLGQLLRPIWGFH